MWAKHYSLSIDADEFYFPIPAINAHMLTHNGMVRPSSGAKETAFGQYSNFWLRTIPHSLAHSPTKAAHRCFWHMHILLLPWVSFWGHGRDVTRWHRREWGSLPQFIMSSSVLDTHDMGTVTTTPSHILCANVSAQFLPQLLRRGCRPAWRSRCLQVCVSVEAFSSFFFVWVGSY